MFVKHLYRISGYNMAFYFTVDTWIGLNPDIIDRMDNRATFDYLLDQCSYCVDQNTKTVVRKTSKSWEELFAPFLAREYSVNHLHNGRVAFVHKDIDVTGREDGDIEYYAHVVVQSPNIGTGSHIRIHKNLIFNMEHFLDCLLLGVHEMPRRDEYVSILHQQGYVA